jgi:hypothetical protein
MSEMTIRRNVDGAYAHSAAPENWDRVERQTRKTFTRLAEAAGDLGFTFEMSYDLEKPEADRIVWIDAVWERCMLDEFDVHFYKSRNHVGDKRLHEYVSTHRHDLDRLARNDVPREDWTTLFDDLSIREIDCCDEERAVRWRYRRRQSATDDIPHWVNDGDVVNGSTGIKPSALVKMWDGYRVVSRYTLGFGPAHVCREGDSVPCTHYR